MAGIIQEGDRVLLRRDKNSRVFQVKQKRKIRFEKANFTLDGVIGEPFGATFRIHNNEMLRMTDPDQLLNEMLAADKQASSGKDNRDLVVGENNQKLSQEDILKMKEDGKCGTEIIHELMANSETFDNKTEFSQRKYLKKKMKKHVVIFTVLKPNARLLIDMVYSQNPAKIASLRIDSLSQILTYANIMAGVNAAIVDTLQGLVVGSAMERMGGFGNVVQFYPGSDLSRHAVEMFNFPSSFHEHLHSYQLKKLPQLTMTDSNLNPVAPVDVQSSSVSTDTEMTVAEHSCGDPQSRVQEEAVDSITKGEDEDEGDAIEKGDNSSVCVKGDANGVAVGKKRRRDSEEEAEKLIRFKKQQYVKDLILQKNFDCLIVACRFHPTPIVLALLEYVAPSRPVVVYSAHKEALMDCYAHLKERGGIINLQLSETWYREYQVLPARTHPDMQMTGTGGYLLTCTTVTT